MKKSIADKWVRALRSGKYKQGVWMLKSLDRFCCLGVLCEIQKIKSDDCRVIKSHMNPLKTGNGVIKSLNQDLAGLNDSGDFTFDEIADLIQMTYEEL